MGDPYAGVFYVARQRERASVTSDHHMVQELVCSQAMDSKY